MIHSMVEEIARTEVCEMLGKELIRSRLDKFAQNIISFSNLTLTDLSSELGKRTGDDLI